MRPSIRAKGWEEKGEGKGKGKGKGRGKWKGKGLSFPLNVVPQLSTDVLSVLRRGPPL